MENINISEENFLPGRSVDIYALGPLVLVTVGAGGGALGRPFWVDWVAVQARGRAQRSGHPFAICPIFLENHLNIS